MQNRSSPWKRAVETLLTRKKQLLEDITKKQILTNRWKLEEREHQEFEKSLGGQIGPTPGVTKRTEGGHVIPLETSGIVKLLQPAYH